jgi:hypothetical protein
VFLLWILARLSKLRDEGDVVAIDSDDISVVERSVDGVADGEKVLWSWNLAGENVISVVEVVVELEGAKKWLRLDNAGMN